MRRIHQIKRQFSQGPGSEGNEGNKLDKKDRKKLERQLEELRVDLNYILVRRFCLLQRSYSLHTMDS